MRIADSYMMLRESAILAQDPCKYGQDRLEACLGRKLDLHSVIEISLIEAVDWVISGQLRHDDYLWAVEWCVTDVATMTRLLEAVSNLTGRQYKLETVRDARDQFTQAMDRLVNYEYNHRMNSPTPSLGRDLYKDAVQDVFTSFKEQLTC